MASIASGSFLELLQRTLTVVGEGFPELEQVSAWGARARELAGATGDGAASEAGAALMTTWDHVMRHEADGSPREVPLYDLVRARDVDGLVAADLEAADEALGDPAGTVTETLTALLKHPDMDTDLLEDIFEYVDELCTLLRMCRAVPPGMATAMASLRSCMSADTPLTGDTVTAVIQSLLQNTDSMLAWSTELSRTLQGDTTLMRDCLNLSQVRKAAGEIRGMMAGGGGGSGSGEGGGGGPDGGLDLKALMSTAVGAVMSGLGGAGTGGAQGALGEGSHHLMQAVSMLTSNPSVATDLLSAHMGADHPLNDVLQGAAAMFTSSAAGAGAGAGAGAAAGAPAPAAAGAGAPVGLADDPSESFELCMRE